MLRLNTLGVLAAIGLLSGCATGYVVEDARNVSPGAGASPFNAALTGEYQDLMAFEADQMGDWVDAENYARKAIAAANGETVLPEELADWDLPADRVQELSAARGRLLSALDATGRSKAPQEAARAQAMFDCWVEQQEENHQPDHIAACRDDFLRAMDALEAALAPTAAAPMKAEPQRFTLYFDFDKATLRDDAEAKLREAVAAAQRLGMIEFAITGHADRSGPEDYNMNLSLRRAQAVRDALLQQGIMTQNVSVAARGESEPAVPTPDGVREQANRRVEIILQ